MEITEGESSTGRAEGIESRFLIDNNELEFGNVIWQGTYVTVNRGLYRGMPVAIKRIEKDKGRNVSDERFRKFQREVRMLSKVEHENIVQFIGATTDPALTIVTELMEEGSVKYNLESMRRNRGKLQLREALTFALGISRAMEHLHANGMMHRSLVPSNIFVTEDRQSVKVGDFGECREVLGGNLTPDIGRFPWIATEMFNPEKRKCLYLYGENAKMPERVLNWRPNYNHKVDVFSFAHVLCELITNKSCNEPVKNYENLMVFGDAQFELRSDTTGVPPKILPLITKCWHVDPLHRPEFEEISKTLEAFLSDMPSSSSGIQAPHTSPNSSSEKEKEKGKKKIAKIFSKAVAKVRGWIRR